MLKVPGRATIAGHRDEHQPKVAKRVRIDFRRSAVGRLAIPHGRQGADSAGRRLRAAGVEARMQFLCQRHVASGCSDRSSKGQFIAFSPDVRRNDLFGVVNMTRALAAELGKENINVNSIAPGNVATPLNAHVRGPGNEEYVELMKTLTPTGIAFMDPEDMAGTAVFLATDDSKMVHGETIIVDAGWSVW